MGLNPTLWRNVNDKIKLKDYQWTLKRDKEKHKILYKNSMFKTNPSEVLNLRRVKIIKNTMGFDLRIPNELRHSNKNIVIFSDTIDKTQQ